MTEEIKCQKYNSDFCFNECFYRGLGCAYEHTYPRKKKKESQPKKIDVVKTMDRIERRESLEEGREAQP